MATPEESLDQELDREIARIQAEAEARERAERARAEREIAVIEARRRAERERQAELRRRKAERQIEKAVEAIGRSQVPVGRRATAGVRPVTVPVPPPRVEVPSVMPQRTVTVSPPPHVVRRQAGLGLPGGRDLLEAVFGALGGALISAIFISSLKGDVKWVGALLTGSLGVVLAATSPLGTIPSELGMGAAAASGSWMFFDLTGQIPSTSGVVEDRAPWWV